MRKKAIPGPVLEPPSAAGHDARGEGVNCDLTLKALNDDEIRYDLHTCVEHLLAVMEAEKLEAKEAAWRMTLDKVIGVRHDLLDLLYEDEPAVPAEAALSLYRDALLEACGHK